MEEKLRAFLAQYIGRGVLKKDIVTEEAVDIFVHFAQEDHIEQEIIDYGTAHPEAPFRELLGLIKPMTPEEAERLQKEIDEEEDE